MLPDTVQVWSVRLAPSDAENDWGVLAPDERDRARRYRFEIDRRRYVRARSALRSILADHLGTRPAAIEFAYSSHGKPYIAGFPLHFNLSHSGDLALIAVSRRREVGVDIEKVRPTGDLAALARRFFSLEECLAIDAAPPVDRVAAFYRCWTRKEAYLKARGDGLSVPLDSFTVPIEDLADATLLRSAWGAEEVARWNFCSIPCSPGYTAALAVERGPVEVQIQNFEVAA